MLWTIIRKARNHCQDVDNRGDEDHCQTGNHCQDREHSVRMEMSMQINDQDQWSALKYN